MKTLKLSKTPQLTKAIRLIRSAKTGNCATRAVQAFGVQLWIGRAPVGALSRSAHVRNLADTACS
jgi:hypothetical protein